MRIGMKTKFLGLAVGAAALAMTAATGAKAETSAFASLNVSNFTVSVSNLGAFNITQIQNTTNLQVNLDGNNDSNAGQTSGTVIAPPATLDLAPLCLGSSCPIANNTFGQASGAMQNFSRADSVISGNSLLGTATSDQVAEVSLTGNSVAGSNVRNGLVASFGFTVVDPLATLSVSFTAQQLYQILIDMAANSGLAESNFEFGVTISNANTGAQVFNWQPDGNIGTGISGGTESADDCNLNQGPFTVTVPGANSGLVDSGICNQGFTTTAGIFTAGQSYTFNLQATTDVRAEQDIPEPGTLLGFGFGVGMLGLFGFLARRRSTQAA